MTVRICLLGVAVVLTTAPVWAGFTPLPLTNTGVGIGNGRADPNWSVFAEGQVSVQVQATVVDRPGFPFFQAWAQNSTASKWLIPSVPPGVDINDTSNIQPNFTHAPDAVFAYQTTFVMPTAADPLSATIGGRFWADDRLIGVLVNGIAALTFPVDGPSQYAEGGAGIGNIPFTIAPGSYFTAGTNRLTFRVRNGSGAISNPTGFRAEFDVAQANVPNPVAAVPAPPTIVAAVLGMVVLGLIRKPRRPMLA